MTIRTRSIITYSNIKTPDIMSGVLFYGVPTEDYHQCPFWSSLSGFLIVALCQKCHAENENRTLQYSTTA
jgi:hypothetical protein